MRRIEGLELKKVFRQMRGNYIHSVLFKTGRGIGGQVKKPGRFEVETEM